MRRALEYLGTLAKEAGGDRSLQRELAEAYEQLGEVQGGSTANLGDTAGAVTSYHAARAIRETLLAADPNGTSEAEALRRLPRIAGGNPRGARRERGRVVSTGSARARTSRAAPESGREEPGAPQGSRPGSFRSEPSVLLPEQASGPDRRDGEGAGNLRGPRRRGSEGSERPALGGTHDEISRFGSVLSRRQGDRARGIPEIGGHRKGARRGRPDERPLQAGPLAQLRRPRRGAVRARPGRGGSRELSEGDRHSEGAGGRRPEERRAPHRAGARVPHVGETTRPFRATLAPPWRASSRRSRSTGISSPPTRETPTRSCLSPTAIP